MEKPGNRIAFIDLAKGLCIMLVVFHHTASTFGLEHYPLKMAFASFRMPLYFFLSGMFFKTYRDFLDFLCRKTNKLLIPFTFFFIFTSCLLPILLAYFGLRHAPPSNVWVSFFFKENFPNIPIWFLLGLFFSNLLFYLSFRISEKFKNFRRFLILELISISLGALGFLLGKLQINLPMFIDSAMISLPFFFAGYFTKHYTKFLYTKRKIWNVPLAILLFAIPALFCTESIHYLENKTEMAFSLIYVFGLSGTLSILLISKVFQKIPLISYLGRYSIIVLLIHGWVIWALVQVYHRFHLHFSSLMAVALIFLLTILICLGFIPLFRKFLPWVCAQKDLIVRK